MCLRRTTYIPNWNNSHFPHLSTDFTQIHQIVNVLCFMSHFPLYVICERRNIRSGIFIVHNTYKYKCLFNKRAAFRATVLVLFYIHIFYLELRFPFENNKTMNDRHIGQENKKGLQGKRASEQKNQGLGVQEETREKCGSFFRQNEQ